MFNVRNGEGNWDGKCIIKKENLINNNYVFKPPVKCEEDNAWKSRVKGRLNNLEVREMSMQIIMRYH